MVTVYECFKGGGGQFCIINIMSVQPIVVLYGEMGKKFNVDFFMKILTEGAVATLAESLFQYFTTLTARTDLAGALTTEDLVGMSF